MICAPPGRRSIALSRRLGRFEAPGVNTLYGGTPSILWEEARGANLLDVDGNRYIDLTSGFGAAAVGHRHPAVVSALRRQSTALLHGLGDVHAHPGRVLLAERLARRAPLREAQVYFAASGSEAVEIALKTALLATGRPGILAFDPAYHGLTLGALGTTSRREFRLPFLPHLGDHIHRLPFGCAVERIVEELRSSPDIGCAIVEPIVGREGVLLPPAGWLPALAAACRELDVLLIADEILTGFGRTGQWFACDHEAVEPDLLCCGKALAGGLPIAAALGRRRVMSAWPDEGEALHTTTFLANPLSCAAALAVLDILEEERLPARAGELGEELAARLDDWPDRFPSVQRVRGRGLLWGVELSSSEAAGSLVAAAAREGLLLLAGGPRGRVAQILPPLTITRRQLGAAVQILEQALEGISAQ